MRRLDNFVLLSLKHGSIRMLGREQKGEIKGYGSREVPRADEGDEGECEIDESWKEMESPRWIIFLLPVSILRAARGTAN